jgi:hypothetical protein
MVDFLIISVAITVIVSTVFFMLLPRYGPHNISRLTCPKCKKKFNYHWVPGASFVSLYRGNKRRLRCPYCHEVSTFDIAPAKITKLKIPPKSKLNQ